MDTNQLGQGLVRGGQRVVLHLLKAGVEVLRGIEGFFEELSSATGRSSKSNESGPTRIPLE